MTMCVPEIGHSVTPIDSNNWIIDVSPAQASPAHPQSWPSFPRRCPTQKALLQTQMLVHEPLLQHWLPETHVHAPLALHVLLLPVAWC